MFSTVKCRKCRKPIFSESETKNLFLNAHSSPVEATAEDCVSIQQADNVFISEDVLPQWILLRIQEEKWSKGRLNCPSCESRIGAFDFVSGLKCYCSNYVLPPVHIIKSKVDLEKANNNK